MAAGEGDGRGPIRTQWSVIGHTAYVHQGLLGVICPRLGLEAGVHNLIALRFVVAGINRHLS